MGCPSVRIKNAHCLLQGNDSVARIGNDFIASNLAWGLFPKPLDLVGYHVHLKNDLTDLEKGMPWQSVQDEFGKYRWINHEGRMYQRTPYAIEQDPTEKTLFVEA